MAEEQSKEETERLAKQESERLAKQESERLAKQESERKLKEFTDSRNRRQKLIEQIEKKRGSKVIVYFTSDRPGLSWNIEYGAVSILHKHLRDTDEKDRHKLDLILYSLGGQSDVPWNIVSMFREYVSLSPECAKAESGDCDNKVDCSFNVLIPYKAYSAATVIALGADEIVMTKKAELGPIDATISQGAYNPRDPVTNVMLPISVEDVNGYFAILNKIGCDRINDKIKGFELLTQKVHPMALGDTSRLLEETKLIASRLLSTRSEKVRFSDDVNNEIVKQLSSEIYSHSHPISRSEAKKYLKLQVTNVEDYGIDNEMWELFEEYKKFFELDNAFEPEINIFLQGRLGYIFRDLNFALVESINNLDVYKRDLLVRKEPMLPSKIDLKVNVKLPDINIPIDHLIANADQQQINILIKEILYSPGVQENIKNSIDEATEKATKTAIQELQLAAPSRYARTYLNPRWVSLS